MRSWKNGTPETARKPWSNGENMSKGLSIPFDVADRITLVCLEEQLGYLRKEVRDHIENGSYMHPEDFHNSCVNLIPALKVLVSYYGGEVDD